MNATGCYRVEVALQWEGRLRCAGPPDFPVAGDRAAPEAALQRQTKDIVAWFRRAMAILCAGHFAERQRFAEGIDEDGDIAAGDLVVNGDSPAIKENIIEAKGPAGGRAVARSTLIACQLKGPVIVVFRQADQPYVGLLQLDPRQVHRFAQQRQRAVASTRGRWIMVTWEWPAGCPARYPPRVRGATGSSCASRARPAAAPRPRRDRRGWRTGG